MTATAKSKQKSKGHGRAAKGAITTKRSRARVQSSRARVKSSKEPVAQSSIGKTAANVLAGAANAVRALVLQLVADEATATALLEKQHREVERSFATALGTEDARIRRSALDDILRQLTMHTDIEEAIFYPAVRALDTEKGQGHGARGVRGAPRREAHPEGAPEGRPEGGHLQGQDDRAEGADRPPRRGRRERDVPDGGTAARSRAEPRARRGDGGTRGASLIIPGAGSA